MVTDRILLAVALGGFIVTVRRIEVCKQLAYSLQQEPWSYVAWMDIDCAYSEQISKLWEY